MAKLASFFQELGFEKSTHTYTRSYASNDLTQDKCVFNADRKLLGLICSTNDTDVNVFRWEQSLDAGDLHHPCLDIHVGLEDVPDVPFHHAVTSPKFNYRKVS